DLSSIPIQDNQYDMVICTQVLEHVPEPKAVLAELHRVLKLRGELWLSAPLFFP
ncbi:MAG: class I SAM-dependent methyltransferase, partial [Phycisphaerae bacterium]|nr:class I SAM-dependent methyltransferase [Phycisphaerae bacterium]NIX30778.1 methyltransferase domain-containing protein [Phycisphaerae bacterium]